MEVIIVLLDLLLVDVLPLKRKPLACNSAGILYFCASAVYQWVYYAAEWRSVHQSVYIDNS
jgi:hypothetical protein